MYIYIYIGFTVTCKLWIWSKLGHRWWAMLMLAAIFWPHGLPAFRRAAAPGGELWSKRHGPGTHHFLPDFEMEMAEKWLKNDEITMKWISGVECTIRQQNMITPTSTFPVTSYLQNFLWCLSLSMLLKTNIAARQISVPPGWNPAFSVGLSVEQFPMS